MLKWVVRGNPTPLGSCTPEFYRKCLDLEFNSLETKSEGYLTDGSSYQSEDEEGDSVFGDSSVCGDSNNNNSVEQLNVNMNNKFQPGFVRVSLTGVLRCGNYWC